MLLDVIEASLTCIDPSDKQDGIVQAYADLTRMLTQSDSCLRAGMLNKSTDVTI